MKFTAKMLLLLMLCLSLALCATACGKDSGSGDEAAESAEIKALKTQLEAATQKANEEYTVTVKAVETEYAEKIEAIKSEDAEYRATLDEITNEYSSEIAAIDERNAEIEKNCDKILVKGANGEYNIFTNSARE